ncbi:MAG: hypothetical protein IJF17_14025 [Thermoguttaceae bacterium]|nr:hypothetical protein [Thermoguttaceae bacterium]
MRQYGHVSDLCRFVDRRYSAKRVRRELIWGSGTATIKQSPCPIPAKGLTACIAVSKSGECA